MRNLLALLVVIMLFSCVGVYAADTSARDVSIYSGTSVAQAGITLGGWGTGSAVETKEKILTGGYSIKISTQSLYSGGRMDFDSPIAITVDGVKKDEYMLFTFFFSDVDVINPAAGTNYWSDVEPYTMPKASRVRFVFTFDNGLSVSDEEPTNPLDVDDNWVRIAVPLAKLNLPDAGKGLHLKRIVMTSDAPGNVTSPAAMYLGEVKIITDDEPIKVDDLSSQVVIANDDVFIVPTVTAGYSSLKYSWDFDSSNGIQEDYVNRVGRVVYRKGGDFTVTLTVSDINGIKEPAQATGTISVND